MDDLVASMNCMRAGPHDSPTSETGSADERGVPVDYTAASGGWDDHIDSRDVLSSANESLPVHASPQRYGLNKHTVIDYFRNGKGTALLTRNYDGDGTNWGDYVLNISMNEALRTRGGDCYCMSQG